ncbi:MAG TPA: type II toxin-antitoxin system VapC family toxin [Gemmatales bacterium]|nr:type II toxin-antitoxin system VapC family toxin [Gemmatales bacterium]HMP60620.1 type II toxin-antitoxin system VapC family toxin [Gemmatales bacterium]
MIAGLDTQALIWAMPWWSIRPKQNQDVEEMSRRARILVRTLASEKAKTIVPTVVVSEFLAGISEGKHGEVLSALSSKFFCASFDIRAADLAARLAMKTRGLPKAEQGERQILRADILIVATAKIAGAAVFYSNDARCRKLAGLAEMKALDLPTHSENLFENNPASSELDDG